MSRVDPGVAMARLWAVAARWSFRVAPPTGDPCLPAASDQVERMGAGEIVAVRAETARWRVRGRWAPGARDAPARKVAWGSAGPQMRAAVRTIVAGKTSREWPRDPWVGPLGSGRRRGTARLLRRPRAAQAFRTDSVAAGAPLAPGGAPRGRPDETTPLPCRDPPVKAALGGLAQARLNRRPRRGASSRRRTAGGPACGRRMRAASARWLPAASARWLPAEGPEVRTGAVARTGRAAAVRVAGVPLGWVVWEVVQVAMQGRSCRLPRRRARSWEGCCRGRRAPESRDVQTPAYGANAPAEGPGPVPLRRSQHHAPAWAQPYRPGL